MDALFILALMILTVWLTWDLYESKEMQREIEYDDIIKDSIRKEP